MLHRRALFPNTAFTMAINEIKKEKLTESICRLCFAEREHYQLIFIDDYFSLNEWIENLTTLKIMKVPNAPASLCSECENTLQNFESFREMCFTNDRIFKEMFAQDDRRNNHTAVLNNMPEVSGVQIDHNENQETDILDATISQVNNTEIKIEYPDISTEVAASLNPEENNYVKNSGHCENQETYILDSTISQLDNTEITIEYSDIKTEVASSLNLEENYDEKTAENESIPDTEEELELEESESLSEAGTNEEKSHICSFCRKGFLNSNRLKIHIRSHTQERSHTCKDCGKSFITPSSLKRHELSHSGLKPYSCDKCPAKYNQSSHLVRHRSVHQKERHTITKNVTFVNKSSHTEYVQEYGMNEPVKANGVKDKRKHCTICNKFVHRLNQHQLVHNKIRPYQCEYCPKGFTQAYKLTQHIRKHTNEKPFVCSHCDKGFTCSADLKIHVRSHTQERPFKCKNCNKAFITSGHLLRHTQTHSGLKPFSCDMCQAHFAQKSHLVRHQKIHAKSAR